MTVRDLSLSPHAPHTLRRAVLRHRSSDARDLLASAATGRTTAELRSAAALPDDVDWAWATALASVLAVQPLADGDQQLALRLYRAAPQSALARRDWSVYARLLAAHGDRGALDALLRDHGRHVTDLDALEMNLVNPALVDDGDPAAFSSRVTRVLAGRGMPGVRVADGDGPVFDRLRADDRPGSVGGPLVTVVMTTFRSGPRLLTALRSVVGQTWADLQIIVVDDCSGPEYDDVLAEAAALDERVELVRLERNGGTYRARDAAIARAAGEFVTGHDDDDWAHPQRIEAQLRPLLADPALPATMSRAVWASDDLEVAPLGWPSVGNYAPSYLVRKDVLDRAGRYLPARKAADTELIRRVAAVTGRQPHVHREALTVYRTAPGSLSRADFLPGWDHPARVAFWDLATDAHERIAAGELDPLRIADHVHVPERFRVERRDRATFDVLVVADWRAVPRAAPSPAVDEVEALAAAGMHVGVVQVEDLRAAGAARGAMEPRLRRLVNDRVADLVTLDDTVHARVLLVRDPGALLFAPHDVVVTADRTIVVADQLAGDDPVAVTSLAVGRCDDVLRRLWGHDPLWVAEDVWLLERLRTTAGLDPERLHDEPYLGVAPGALHGVRRPRRLLGRPVVGAVLPGSPEAADSLRTYLTGRLDIRLLGGRTTQAAPPGWLLFPGEETSPADYYAQLDVLVRSPTDGEGLGAEVGHALAAGCVVVLPERFRDTVGDIAVYAAPGGLLPALESLRSSPREYREHVARVRRHAQEHLTADAFVARFTRLSGSPAPVRQG